jgi:hypothetical protein
MKIGTKKNHVTTRSLMPKGYIKILQERTGYSPGTISTAVNSEDVDSPLWVDIIHLAKETQQKRQKAFDLLKRLKAVAA